MRILVLIISLTLLAGPSLAGPMSYGDQIVIAAADNSKRKPSRGKVVISGKGGKVTDVKKKPKKGDKK